MDRCDRRRGGFTAIELLVVLAVMGTAANLILPAIQGVRAKQNQVLANAAMEQIVIAEQSFRNFDLDGDLVDDYGTLAELGSLMLLPPGVAGGASGGYAFSMVNYLIPKYEARAVPLTPKTGVLRFYVDETGVVRFSETGTPGPASPPLPPGGEYEVPLTLERALCLDMLGFAAEQHVRLADVLGGGGHVPEAIDLVLAGDVVDAILAQLDANGDDALSLDELLAADLLGAAQVVADGLGGAPGPVLGSDADLAALLAQYQASTSSLLELALDAPQPDVPLSDLLGHETTVGAFLQAMIAPVPSLGAAPLALTAGLLLWVGTRLLRRARAA